MLLFAGNFIRHPYMLGSIIPSSRFLVNQVLEPIDWERARVIVEYGPGVGTITGEILRRMHSDAHLVAIETNRAFVRFLQSSLPRCRRCCGGSDCRWPAISFQAFRWAACRSACAPIS